jgi:hypothetical protein
MLDLIIVGTAWILRGLFDAYARRGPQAADASEGSQPERGEPAGAEG